MQAERECGWRRLRPYGAIGRYAHWFDPDYGSLCPQYSASFFDRTIWAHAGIPRCRICLARMEAPDA